MRKLLFTLMAAGVLALGVAQRAQADAPTFVIVCIGPDGQLIPSQPVPPQLIRNVMTTCAVTIGGHVYSIERVS